jgi:V8-like Glu-specific endopeptidase
MKTNAAGVTIVFFSFYTVNAEAESVIRLSPRQEAPRLAFSQNDSLPSSSVRSSGLLSAISSFRVNLGPVTTTKTYEGDGRLNPVSVQLPINVSPESEGKIPPQFGTSDLPFTTSHASPTGVRISLQYPFRAVGKLIYRTFDANNDVFNCSASVIGRSLVVTAAHCVTKYGSHAKFAYNQFQFFPGLYRTNSSYVAPFGTWGVDLVYVFDSYVNGTGGCDLSGTVCDNDMAVLVMSEDVAHGRYVGDSTGILGVATGGYSFVNNTVQITQLGYPVALDFGYEMERTDAQGFINMNYDSNTVIGSQQVGGSSGGPWIVNFGVRPIITDKTKASFGFASAWYNQIVGVTSWGFDDASIKEQGASPFTTGNITLLINAACKDRPVACNQ